MRNLAVLKSLSIMLGACVLLLGLSVAFEYGHGIQETIEPLKWLNASEIFSPSQDTQSTHLVGEVDSALIKSLGFSESSSKDSVGDSTAIVWDGDAPLYVEGEILPSDTVPTEYLLYNPVRGERSAMEAFYKGLELIENNGKDKLRIAHYGDSQLEGGLISYDLRLLFNEAFHGYGTGFIPLYEPCANKFVIRKLIGNWKRYTCFHDRYTSSKYGYCGTVYRFMPARGASFIPDTNAAPQLATLNLQLYDFVKYQSMLLFWGNAKTPWKLKIYVKDSLVSEHVFTACDSFQVSKLSIKPNTRKMSLVFEAVESPDLYGISFESESGVMVDNLALRGHSGNGFHKLNIQFLRQQYEKLNHKLVILQFGGNIIPYTKVRNFKWYEDDLYRILLRFKQSFPSGSILVVSNMDMGFKGANGIQSYWTAPLVRDAQKRASLRAGVAFLDLFELMGGSGAILEWYRKGLAYNDLAHLSPKGQKKVAELITQAILHDYQQYKKKSPYSQLKTFLTLPKE